jgi:hypothetical protein
MKVVGFICVLLSVAAVLWAVVVGQRTDSSRPLSVNERSISAAPSGPSSFNSIASVEPADRLSHGKKLDTQSEDLRMIAGSAKEVSPVSPERNSGSVLAHRPHASPSPESVNIHGTLSLYSSTFNLSLNESLPQPAAWVDLGDAIPADAQRDLAIQQEAERLLEEIKSHPPTANPATYHAHWQHAVSRSDQMFRQRYGGFLWMAHHVQAHHLATSQETELK